jgi:hypothetical protein
MEHAGLVAEDRLTAAADYHHPPVLPEGPDRPGYEVGRCRLIQVLDGEGVLTVRSGRPHNRRRDRHRTS